MPNGYRTGQDIGGFGRLAQAELTKRREQRLDKEYESRSRLQDIQLQQAQSNLAEINRKKKIRNDLGVLTQNLPEGENRFTAQYKYLMEQGEQDLAHQGMKRQSDLIDSIYTKNPEQGAKIFNDTIGKVMNTTITPISKVPKKSDLVQATQNGKTVFMKMTPKGFEVVPLPKGVTISDLSGEAPVDPTKLDYWARQFIATGKKVFQVRGKEANRLNRLIAEHAATIQLQSGITGPETVYQQKDREAIQKSIAKQEQQRGSMGSFVINIDKQIEEIGHVAEEISRSDVRLLNKPINWVAKKIAGDPTLAKYRLYLSELQREVSKLSQGATGSVAQLSDAEQRHWASVMDEDMSVGNMMKLLESVRDAGRIRMESVDEALVESRERLRSVGKTTTTPKVKNVVIKAHPEYGDISEDDIAVTMEENNMTRDEVINMLGEGE